MYYLYRILGKLNYVLSSSKLETPFGCPINLSQQCVFANLSQHSDIVAGFQYFPIPRLTKDFVLPFSPRQDTNLILMARLSGPAYKIFLRFFGEFNVSSHLESHCEVNGQKVNLCKTNWHSICNIRQVYIFLRKREE